MEKDLNKNENISKFDNHSKTDKLENSFFLQKFDHKNRKLIEKMKKKIKNQINWKFWYENNVEKLQKLARLKKLK